MPKHLPEHSGPAHAELVVVGGGPAGAVAAATLARQGRPVLLLDAGRRPGAFEGGESLPPLAPALRHELGLAQVLAEGPHLPCYGNAAAWGSPELHHSSFMRSPYGTGWHLDRPIFDAALRAQAVAAGAHYRAGRLHELRPNPTGGWHLGVREGQASRQLTARWVLDCSGRHRVVSRLLGVPAHYADQLVAHYVRYARPAGPPDEERLTLVEAAPWGWGHSAALPSGERIVTLFADAGQPGGGPLGTAAGFAGALAQLPRLAELLSAHSYAPVAPPRATDARSGCLAQLGGAGWLAAGDAATAFDPLAAPGILAAVWAGHQAALALGQALDGNDTALPAYHQQVRTHYEHLRAQARLHYSQERRWPDQPFWQTRQALEQSR